MDSTVMSSTAISRFLHNMYINLGFWITWRISVNKIEILKLMMKMLNEFAQAAESLSKLHPAKHISGEIN